MRRAVLFCDSFDGEGRDSRVPKRHFSHAKLQHCRAGEGGQFRSKKKKKGGEAAPKPCQCHRCHACLLAAQTCSAAGIPSGGFLALKKNLSELSGHRKQH
jgi:hypothetical protein